MERLLDSNELQRTSDGNAAGSPLNSGVLRTTEEPAYDPDGPTMIGKWLATAMMNGLVFIGAAAVAINVAFRLTNSPAFLLLILSVPFAAAGALTRAWSRQPSTVAFPASVVSILLFTLLAMEVYLGDGGDPRIMWRYIPGSMGVLAVLATAGAAFAGWALLGKLHRVRSHAAEQ